MCVHVMPLCSLRTLCLYIHIYRIPSSDIDLSTIRGDNTSSTCVLRTECMGTCVLREIVTKRTFSLLARFTTKLCSSYQSFCYALEQTSSVDALFFSLACYFLSPYFYFGRFSYRSSIFSANIHAWNILVWSSMNIFELRGFSRNQNQRQGESVASTRRSET